ncbi:MAG: hypothetical protein SynsKO_11680 [Synoicihabitans sp.]
MGVGAQDSETSAGVLDFQSIQLSAPDPAIESYLDRFSTRKWTILTPSRGAFIGEILGLEIRSSIRESLFDSSHWANHPDGDGFIVTPDSTDLGKLLPTERRELYRKLASWAQNKPELWPLIFTDDAIWQRLANAGIPTEMLVRTQELCYPFHGGLALSDFSVLAHEFPDRNMLFRFLEIQSKVPSVIPRLRLTTAKSISEVLAYWTSNHQNPFAAPMLEALMESESTEGLELISIMPGSVRQLSYSIEAEDVSYDRQQASYIISSSVTARPRIYDNIREFGQWFNSNFKPAEGPIRYGDVMELNQSRNQIVQFACVYVGKDLVFARDPVGLGVWRFMRMEEITNRNPHFEGGLFQALRLSNVRRDAREN